VISGQKTEPKGVEQQVSQSARELVDDVVRSGQKELRRTQCERDSDLVGDGAQSRSN
jgi:hypothetical protein